MDARPAPIVEPRMRSFRPRPRRPSAPHARRAARAVRGARRARAGGEADRRGEDPARHDRLQADQGPLAQAARPRKARRPGAPRDARRLDHRAPSSPRTRLPRALSRRTASRPANVADGSLGTADLATNAVGTDEIADNAVGQSEIRDNGVGASEIADNSIDGGEIIDGGLSVRDVARQVGTLEWPIDPVAPDKCQLAWVPVSGIQIAGDFVLISPTSPWPTRLVYTVNGTNSENEFKVSACNERGSTPVPAARTTYEFNYAVLGF